jgi:hypothetical protein
MKMNDENRIRIPAGTGNDPESKMPGSDIIYE